ncbi:glycosyltransferase family 2 protein [bacterium]|nr:MAG: glycosyltransferase family 2 protein [bacterium]
MMKFINKNKHETISVCIPTYNSSDTIVGTLKSVLNQSLKDFDLIVVDDASKDDTINKIKNIKDARIRIFHNKKNIGCGKNLQKCKDKARGDIVVFLAGDDLFDRLALEKILNAFEVSKDVGVVIRPYFWFIGNNLSPVRVTRQFKKNTIVNIKSDFNKIIDVISLSDQMSGVSFRKKYLNFPFDNQPFVEMSSAVMKIIKDHKAIILKDNILGVRIGNNGSMNPNVYRNSPMNVWKDTLYSVFYENKHQKLKEYILKNFIAINYVGLIQIKNYGTLPQLLREINYLIKFRWINVFNYKFLFYVFVSLVTPKNILIKLVDVYKKKINSKIINKINFDPGFEI